MWFRFVGLAPFAAVFVVPASAPAPELQTTVEPDVQYCTGGGRPLLMDVFIPNHRNRKPTPAVLWIHGGGWEIGDKSGHSGATFLAHEGFVTASLTYRLSGDAPFPAAIEDCKCAIRFLRAHAANYGIDPDRIGVAGSSAGGHLAELVATADESAGLEGDGGWQNVSSRVEAAASYFGVSDLTARFPLETDRVVVKFLRGSGKDKPELYRRASPIQYVSSDDPPLLVVHGEDDHDVPLEQSVRMAEAYRRLNLTVEFIAVKNAGHDFAHVGAAPISPSVDTIHQRTADFFRGYLVARPASAAAIAQSIPPAIFTDPPVDAEHPPRLTVLQIPTHGVRINAIVYQTSGAGPHPTLVICHGLPGNERFLDVAQAVRRAGWNAVAFNYRGSWGSPGVFRFAQNLEDADAVLAYLRDPANATRLDVDPHRIVIAGHSMGGWVAVHTASHDRDLIGAIIVSAADVGKQGDWPRNRLLALMADSIAPLAGVTPEGMADEVRALGKTLRFENAAAGLAHTPLLALTADDGLASDTDALVRAIQAHGGEEVTEEHVKTDHSWSDHRIALESAVITWLAGLGG